MCIFANVYYYLMSDIITTLISLIIGWIVYKISRIYIRVLSLPPGPIPLPLLGNLLLFRSKHHWNDVIKEVNKKYGPVFTFWMGPVPYIFITDLDIARETFRKNEFSGRPDSFFGKIVSNEKFSNVLLDNYGHRWEALRRVAHSAAQKYSLSDSLCYLVSDCVDQTVKSIIAKEGIDKPFIPFDHIYHIFLNILAASCVGKLYDIEDEEYKQIKYALRDFRLEAGSRFLLWEFSAIIRFFDRKLVNKQVKLINDLELMMKEKFTSHYPDYDQSVIRDFCDTLITAKNDALREGKESAPYLTDDNLAMAVTDLCFAGSDTSQQTFRWILLLITYYPEIQEKLRQEIESEIGDRIATHEDRSRCHYVMAFIAEILRFRNVAPMGFFHSAVVSSKIGSYSVPKGQGIFVYQGIILTDEKYWPNPDQFIPERFLENGKYVTTRPKAYIPFSVGRRVCLGEKLAIADLFLVLVRFLQSTSDYDIVLDTDCDLSPDPEKTDNFVPKDFKILLKKK